MQDFASYSGKKGNGAEEKSAEEKTAEAWVDEAKTVAGKYHGRSEGDMMKEIYARALEGKKNGTLTNEQIDAFYRQFSPMLDGVKRKKLKQVVEQLKKIP
ncbi:MAG: hypothetical protein K2H43_05875, partial [Clostridia bacterium]|nr:hypothetical protein [Clostridia bacterium]